MDNVYGELQQAVSQAFEGPEIKKGNLGYVVNGSFSVIVSRDTSLYYVRYDDGSFEEVPHKGRVSPQRNAPVKVGIDDTGEWSILGVNRDEAASFAGPSAAGALAVGPHSHERGSTMQYLVDPYLLTPLRVKVVSGTTIEITAGRYMDSSGGLHWRISEEVDLSSYITGTSYHHSWLVIWIDQNTGDSGVTAGTSQTMALPLTESQIDSISLPDGAVPLAAIPVKNGQTTLYEVDIRDMRFTVGGFNGDFANQALSNLSSVAINTSLISDTDSTDDLGSTAKYWRNGYIDTLYVSEQSAPSTPAAGKVVLYAKTDGLLYSKDDAGTETPLGGGGFSGDAFDIPFTATTPADWSAAPSDVGEALDTLASDVDDLASAVGSGFGAAVSKTLLSDVVTAGTDRHLVVSAQSGTADDLIEITGLSAGEEVVLHAAGGHTITVKHNSGSATDKIILYGGADMVLSGDKTLKLFKSASGKVVQYVDDSTGGSAPSTGKYITYAYDATNTSELAIPRMEFDADIEPASPHASDDEFPGSSLGGSWSWVNQGSASVAIDKSHMLLSVPSTSTGNIRGIFRTYPGTSTWVAKLTGWSSSPVWSGSNNYSFSITRRDSSSSRLESYSFSWSSSSTAMLILCNRWTNTTTFSTTVASVQLSRSTHATYYLKIEDNGTNLIFSWSLDGLSWTQLTSFARAAFLASADQIGLSIFTQQSSGTIYMQSDFLRRTA